MINQPDARTGPRAARRPGGLGRVRVPLLRAVGFAAGVAAALAAVLAYTLLVPGPRALTERDVDAAVATALASVTPPPAFSQQVYTAIAPSLVVIQVSGPTPSGAAAQASGGTGVVVDSGGDILTSLHVVADASTITLTFADGSQSPGQVTVRRPEDDIAVLQATQPPASLTPATLGNGAAMRVGSEAYVVGDPLGLDGSLSAGVVSGLDRSFQPPGASTALTGLIQIDAAVNPGSWGGPLLDRDGRVVGIVTGLANPTDQGVFIGIGFAVPIEVAGGAAGLPQY